MGMAEIRGNCSPFSVNGMTIQAAYLLNQDFSGIVNAIGLVQGKDSLR
ncbi:MAG: hypothetical protein ABGX83_07800 [Nitrospira sp.]